MNELQLSTDVEETPLTKWPKAPSIKDLKQDLTDSKPAHDTQKQKIAEWLDNLNATGKAAVKTPDGSSKIVPKLIRKQAEWRYAALSEPFLSTDDVFNVKPVSWEDRESAQQNQLVLNNQFNTKINKITFIDEYVRAAVDEGTVIVRVGWDFHEEDYEGEFPQVEFVINPEYAPMHEQIAQMKVESPSQYATDVPEELKEAHELSMEKGVPLQPVIKGYVKETRTRTVKNCPTVEVCDYRNVIIDPSCQGDLDKAGFVIYSFESSKSQLEKDGKYKNIDKINIEGSTPLGQPDHDTSDGTKNFNFTDQARKKFVVHEYWGFWDIDGDGRVKPIVAAWVGNTLIRMEENPYPDKKVPFVTVQYLPVRKSIYGEPDGSLLEDNQKVIGAITRGMIDIMGKSANSQTGTAKGFLDVTNRRKFDKGQDYEYNPGTDPRMSVFMHTYPEIPQSAYGMLQMQNMEAESLTGVKAYANDGISGASLGDVAAGVRSALDAASKRELGILRRLSDGVVKIGRKIISMNAEFLSDEEVIRVTNEDFVTIRRDDLGGNFDLKLSISTAEEDNNKAEQLAFMLQTNAANMDPDLAKMIYGDIAKLRKMPDLAHKIESFEPQPDPLMQRKMEAEVRKLEAEAMEIETTAMLNRAKAMTENVKQGNMKADTDLKNLDFVEQESGVKQERAKELHGEQARSQAQLKLLDRQDRREDRRVDLIKEYIKSRAKAKAA